MTTWRELEADFVAMGKLPMLERQWIDEQEPTWEFTGGVEHLARQRFRDLAVLGGKLLAGVDSPVVSLDVLREQDPEIRWYLALWGFGRPRQGVYGELSKDGKVTGHLHSTVLERPAEVAAALCIHLEAHATAATPPLDRQLSAPRYQAVQAHWVKAQAHQTTAPPDQPNAAKEAVSAVEALAQIVTGDDGDTLGKTIKALRAKGRVSAPLLKGLEELWGFASDTPGVRHGSASPTSLTDVEVEYVFDLARAALRLLLALDNSRP